MGDQAKGLVIGDVFYQDSLAIMVSQNDSKWRNYISWGLQRLWAEGTFQQLYKKAFGIEPTFDLWHNGQLQPGVTTVAKECDPW
jgi:ABC-type amino acid transport substrate-binding protein